MSSPLTPARTVALLASLFTVLSCNARDSPAVVVSAPAPFLGSVSVTLPPGATMTSGTTEQLTIVPVNFNVTSCGVDGPAWLGLSPVRDVNTAWTVTPASNGLAPLVATCNDGQGHVVLAYDTLFVREHPSVRPSISGTVALNVGDSLTVTYDSTATRTMDVACENCALNARIARVGVNAIRFFATQFVTDTLTRGICFTLHGMDGRYTQQQCVTVAITLAPLPLYTLPQAIRRAEVIPLHTIPVATYDKTGQSTHPDFMRVPAAWSAGTCWMAFTPYAGSDGTLENPSLATSPDCENWNPAPGVAAPLIAKPDTAYNSDPELVYDAARGCLGVMFRQVSKVNAISLTKTCDGKTWSAPRLLFSVNNHSAVSPSIALGPDGLNRLWVVDAGPTGCNSQTNVVRLRVATSSTAPLDSLQFGPAIETDLVQPGYVIWHLKVRYIPEKKEYWAMYVAFPMTTGVGYCLSDDLYFASSKDGVHWQSYSLPVLDHLDKRFNFVSLYRASFQYEAAGDNLRTIVSGLAVDPRGANTVWGQYGVVHGYTALRNALNSSINAPAAALVRSPSLARPLDASVKRLKIEDWP